MVAIFFNAGSELASEYLYVLLRLQVLFQFCAKSKPEMDFVPIQFCTSAETKDCPPKASAMSAVFCFYARRKRRPQLRQDRRR